MNDEVLSDLKRALLASERRKITSMPCEPCDSVGYPLTNSCIGCTVFCEINNSTYCVIQGITEVIR